MLYLDNPPFASSLADVSGIHQAEEMLNAAEAEVEKTKEAIRAAGDAGRKRSVSMKKSLLGKVGFIMDIYIYCI